jgi:ferredoxin
MSLSNENIALYRKLQEHLDKMPLGFPSTKSGSDIKLLRRLFTSKEAEIAMYLKFGWNRDLEPLETIYKRAKETEISKEELEQILDKMVQKGLLMFKREVEKKYYGNALLMIGMFEFQVNKLTREFIEDFHEYFSNNWLREVIKVKGAQLRVIPVEQSIESEYSISNYDDVIKLLETTDGPCMVTNCICRQIKDILEQPCKATSRREVCLAFGFAAELYIEQGWGRAISKEEVLEILRKNQEEGLVIQPDNSQNLTVICSCCSCCCEGLSKIKLLPNPGNLTITNFYADVESDLCSGCGTCVEICPMEAITLIDDISSIQQKRCIGCGNCVAKCPSEAIKLYKRERQFIPYPTMDDLYDKIMERKLNLKKKF